MNDPLEKLKQLAFEAGWDAAIENHMYEYVGMRPDETEAFKEWNETVSDHSERAQGEQDHG